MYRYVRRMYVIQVQLPLGLQFYLISLSLEISVLHLRVLHHCTPLRFSLLVTNSCPNLYLSLSSHHLQRTILQYWNRRTPPQLPTTLSLVVNQSSLSQNASVKYNLTLTFSPSAPLSLHSLSTVTHYRYGTVSGALTIFENT